MRTEERNIPFFDWFIKYYPKGLENVNPKYQEFEIQVLSQNWVISPSRKDKVHIQPMRCPKPTKISTKNLKATLKSSKSVAAPNKVSISLQKVITKDLKETLGVKYLDQEQLSHMDHSLNFEEIQIDSLIEGKKESKLDLNHYDNSLVKIDDFL